MKPWYKSKILWVNLILTISLIVEIFTQAQLIPAFWVPWIAAGVAGLNVILRVWFTDTKLI